MSEVVDPDPGRLARLCLACCLALGVTLALVGPSTFAAAVSVVPGVDATERTDTGVASDDVTVPPAVERLHRRGVTGDGVAVGVIDVTGYDANHPALDGHVAESRSFGERTSAPPEARRHGTAVAVSLAELAPDASLYLAEADSTEDVEAAATWLLDRDVDVVVAPFNSLGTVDTGDSDLARALTRLRASGVVVVGSAGNFARGHWRGRLNATPSGRHSFDGEVRNRLYSPHVAPDRPVETRLWLTWNGSRFPHDLNLELHRATPTGLERVAVSRRVRTGAVWGERIARTLPPGDYYVVVDVPDRTLRTTDDPSPTVEVTAAAHRFRVATPNGSIAAPATAPGVLAVGAYDATGARVAAYSSRGPTPDGRRGVDVVAPVGVMAGVEGVPDAGTSAAATHAGATAALVASADDSLSAAAVEDAIETTAADEGPAGPDPVTGHGVIDPSAAVARVASGDDASAAGRDAAADRRRDDENTREDDQMDAALTDALQTAVPHANHLEAATPLGRRPCRV